ncbi:MAG: 3-dehydrosphinganine reductase [Halieaceae bacterium]|jgi:3-dehydrosphinganine reductase
MSFWKLAFVTGGGSGIGRAMAVLLMEQGTSVAVFDRSDSPEARSQLQEVAARYKGVRCEFYKADVTDNTAVVTAVEAAVAEMGAPDFALNCAGIQIAKHFEGLSQEEFEQVVGVNLFGSRNFAAATLPHMTEGAQFALMASLAGLVGSYSYSAYNASKHAVVGLAIALRLDYIERGIEVSVICPPEINTPMVVEERKTISPAGAKLKDAAGSLELGPACDYMIKKLQSREFMIVPGFKARAVTRIARWFPNMMRAFSERTVISTLRKT